MKNIALLFSIILVFSVKSNAQTICDSITIDYAVLTTNTIDIQVYNSSGYFFVYPIFTVSLDANPFVSLNETIYYPTFLSIASDGNNGYTSSSFLANVTPETAVPVNTLFTGTLTITDPNDGSFICTIPFSFTYGLMLTNGVNELNETNIQLFPNPVKTDLNFTEDKGFSKEDAQINIFSMTGELIHSEEFRAQINLEKLKSGIYLVKIESKNGTITRKIIKE